MNDYSTARQNMIDNQIHANKVTDTAIIEAFDAVPRERFVPHGRKSVAYADEELPIGGGRYLIEPMILARLLQDALPGEDDVALDIGCAKR